MTSSTVALVQTTPATVLADYRRAMRLSGYRDFLPRDRDTALKMNISWHHYYPACSTTPWQADGVIRTLKADGYSPDRIHACHNRTVVIDAHLGERENKHLPVIEHHGLRNIHLYENEEWVNVRDAVGDLARDFLCLNAVSRGWGSRRPPPKNGSACFRPPIRSFCWSLTIAPWANGSARHPNSTLPIQVWRPI